MQIGLQGGLKKQVADDLSW